MRKIFRLLALAGAAGLAGCGGDGTNSNEQGHVRLLNMTSSTGLDLVASSGPIAAGVAPYVVSTYADLKPDTYSLDVRETGNAATLVTGSTNVTRKRFQTGVAYNTGGSTAVTFVEDEEDAPGNGKAKFRVFNTASADVGKVDVYLVSNACKTLETSAFAPTAPDVGGLESTYREMTSSATAYHLCVTGSGDRSDLRLELPSIVLSEKRIVTVVLGRGPGGYLLNGVVLDQQGTAEQALNASARVRVAASVSPAVPASVEINGTAVSAGLNSPNVGPYTLVPAGAVTAKFNGAAITPVAPFTAAPGADVTVLLTGPAPTMILLPDDNTVSSSSARPVKLRMVNGLNGVPGTATLTLNNVLVGSGAEPGKASGYTQVAASAGLARLEARNGAAQLYFKDSATLESGRVYTLFLLGDPPPSNATATSGILVPDR
jgi:hypothetical protein